MTTASSSVLDRAPALPEAPALCRHCGDVCVADEVRTAAGSFCCNGCASVFALLETHGLTQFYACDPDAGVSQRRASSRAADRFAVLDDPAVSNRFVDAHDGTFSHVTFSVPSLH